MGKETEGTTEVQVIGPNQLIAFQGHEIRHEDEIIPNLIGRRIFRAYRNAQSDVGITLLFDDGTWFSFGYSAEEGLMVAGNVDRT